MISRFAAEATALGGKHNDREPMRPSRPTIVLAVCVALVSGCARAVPESGGSFARCYKISLGRWSPEMDLRADTVFIIPPRAVALAAEPSGSRLLRNWLSMQPAPGVPMTVHRHQGWSREGEKPNLRLIWTTGYAGVEAVVAADGRGTLRGRARTRWDTPRPRQEADIVLTQTSCGSG